MKFTNIKDVKKALKNYPSKLVCAWFGHDFKRTPTALGDSFKTYNTTLAFREQWTCCRCGKISWCLLALLLLLPQLAHACEIEPGDWAEVEEELQDE